VLHLATGGGGGGMSASKSTVAGWLAGAGNWEGVGEVKPVLYCTGRRWEGEICTA